MTVGTCEVPFGGRRLVVAGPALHSPLNEFRQAAGATALPATAGTLVWQLARDLSDSGCHVAIVTLDDTTDHMIRVDSPNMPVVVGPYRIRHRMRDFMCTERVAVRKAVWSLAPDLVHAHWCYEYALGALASGIPTLVTVHDWIPAILRYMDARYWPYWSGRAVMYAATLAQARHLTANSPYMAARVKPLARGAVEVIPNGFPDDEFTAHDDANGGKASPARAFISVNNGFSPRKNVGTLLQAFSSVRSHERTAELHLAGDGYEPGGDCDAWAQQRRLTEGVQFLGRVPRDRLLSSLSGYVALMHPSKEESFGMTLVEAMSKHVAVIGGARSGAVPWVLANGAAGILVDPDDPRDIALAMEALLADEELRRRLAEAGYDHAFQRFRQSRVTAQYLDAYARVLAEEGRPL